MLKQGETGKAKSKLKKITQSKKLGDMFTKGLAVSSLGGNNETPET